MRRILLRLFLFGGAFIAEAFGSEPAEIVVASRYLQAKGVSHAHLYLFGEDGKLLRQLTADNSGQDCDPHFAPDGETIVFSREKPGSEALEIWSVRQRGGALKRLAVAPAWYLRSTPPAVYTQGELPLLDPDAPAPMEEPGQEKPRTYRSPDESFEVVVRRLGIDDDLVNGPGTGKHFLLRDLKSAEEVEMGTFPGFLGLWDVLHVKGRPAEVFLLQGALRVVFFSLHLNSTDGDTRFALDLNERCLVRLSENSAVPVPLPGEPAFLTVAEVRYVPIPASTKTANCTYLERWDAKLKKVRYAASASAAIFYGASIYRRGRAPATLHIGRAAD